MTLFGLSLFPDLSAGGIAALVAIYFFSFALKGMFGLGAMPPLVIFGSWVVGPHHAVVLAVIANVFSQLQFTPEGLRHGDLRLVRSLVIAYIPATILGVWIFGTLESDWLTAIVGLLLIGILSLEGSALMRRYDRAFQERATVLAPVMSAVSGVVGGVAGAGGVLLVSTYVRMVCSDARVLRASVILIATIFVTWRTVVYAANGFVPLAILVECVVLLPIIVVGGYTGSKLFGLFPRDRFFFAFRIFLILASLNLVAKGVISAFAG